MLDLCEFHGRVKWIRSMHRNNLPYDLGDWALRVLSSCSQFEFELWACFSSCSQFGFEPWDLSICMYVQTNRDERGGLEGFWLSPNMPFSFGSSKQFFESIQPSATVWFESVKLKPFKTENFHTWVSGYLQTCPSLLGAQSNSLDQFNHRQRFGLVWFSSRVSNSNRLKPKRFKKKL